MLETSDFIPQQREATEGFKLESDVITLVLPINFLEESGPEHLHLGMCLLDK